MVENELNTHEAQSTEGSDAEALLNASLTEGDLAAVLRDGTASRPPDEITRLKLALLQKDAPDRGWWRALVSSIVDAAFDKDASKLDQLSRVTRDAAVDSDARARADALLSVIERADSRLNERPDDLAPGTHSYNVFSAIFEQPDIDSSALAETLQIDRTEVSRQTSRLVGRGLIVRHQKGKAAHWHLSVRGEVAASYLQLDNSAAKGPSLTGGEPFPSAGTEPDAPAAGLRESVDPDRYRELCEVVKLVPPVSLMTGAAA